jgi:hypothetical protein
LAGVKTNYFWLRTTINNRVSQERRYRAAMFAFFSNRLGCLGSIAVSVIGTIVLLVLMRGCQM